MVITSCCDVPPLDSRKSLAADSLWPLDKHSRRADKPWWAFRTARSDSRAPRRASAGIALHAGAVAHQGEVPAFPARFALVALGLGLGAFLCRRGLGVRLRPRQLLERLGGRGLGLGL